MKILAKRLVEGQDLYDEIENIAKENNIKAGIVLSAVGSLRVSKIRLPIINGQVNYLHPSNLEIDNLHGTVSINGCHLHITVSDLEGKVMGGHIKSGNLIRTTCELVIGVIEDSIFKREPDPKTGFDELVL